MRKCLKFMFLMGVWLMVFSACSVKEMEPKGVVNGELKAYTLNTPNKYSGMGQYLHEIQGITILSESPYSYELSGEVRSDVIDRSKELHHFLIKGYVDETSWVETYDDSLLGESDLRQVVLLKEPLLKGAKWDFKTTDKQGKKQKIAAEIVKIDKDEIEVVYTNSSDFYEKRLFKKNLGTVKFIKEFKIGDTKAVTGYALVKQEPSEKNIYDTLVPIEAKPEIITLLRNFNEAMVKADLTVQKSLIVLDSPAHEKLSVGKESTKDWSFEGLKIYKKEEKESSVTVTVLEKFRQKDSVYYNAVQYELVLHEGQYRIFDFEPMDFILE